MKQLIGLRAPGQLFAILLAAPLYMANLTWAASPAETAITAAQTDIAQHPDHAPFYNALAAAYLRRARETSDVQYYAKAEEALDRSFALAPDNFEGLKTRVWLLISRCELAPALELATKLNKQAPDDVMVYGYLADANTGLGNYSEAVAAIQWMLDLRRGNLAALTRAAYQRELHGNLAGASDYLQMAYDATPFAQTEERAWLLAQMARVALTSGEVSKAEVFGLRSLGVFPDDHYALDVLAKIRMSQKRYEDAVTVLRKRYALVPRPANLFALAEALELAGKTGEAQTAFAEFERGSLAKSNEACNSNRERIAYYVDHAHQPAKALEIAQRELARRHDVFTLDSYAWALAATGDYEGAQAQMQKVLDLGIKDSRILSHAEFIAAHTSPATRTN